jgi:hypothetical protein
MCLETVGVRVPSVPLGRCAPDVLGPRTLRPFAKIEFDAVALLQILKAFAIHGAPVKKVLLPRIVLDEPEPLVNSLRSNRSHHRVLPFCSVSICAINRRRLAGIRGRPGFLGFHRQNNRNAFRCQRISVSGLTITSNFHQSTNRDNTTSARGLSPDLPKRAQVANLD